MASTVFGEGLFFELGIDLEAFRRAIGQGITTARAGGAKIAQGLAGATSTGVKKLNAAGQALGSALTVVGTGAAAAGAGFAALGAGAIQTGAQFEMLETRLAVLLGSAEAGAARMEEIFAFASSTPFELNELVEAEVNLRALGLEAEAVLPLVMDFAGAMGEDLASSAVEVGRAMQFGAGAVESMAGRALRAQVELRTGQDALAMSTAEFREELTETLTDPSGIFAGGTEKLAGTFQGMISNLEDSWTGFQKSIADSGLFTAVSAAGRELLAILEENEQQAKDLASEIGTGIVAGLQIAVKGAGFFYDAWTLVKGALLGAWGLVVQIGISAAEASLAIVEMADHIPGLDTSSAQSGFTKALNAGTQQLAELDAEALAVAEDLGAGAAMAERLAAALDTRSSGSVIQGLGATGATGGAGGAADGGTGKGKADTSAADFRAMLEQQLADERELLDIARAEQIAKNQAFLDEKLIQEDEFAANRMLIEENYLNELAALEAAAEEKRRAEQQKTVDMALGLQSDLFSALDGLLDAHVERTGRANLGLFRFQQGLAVSEIAVNTAVAAMRALRDLGPIAGGIAAGVIGTTGALQAAAVLAEEPPGQIVYHRGGEITAADGLPVSGGRPDERWILGQVGETVSSREASRQPQGAPAPQVSVLVQYDRRTLNRALVDLQRDGAAGVASTAPRFGHPRR